MCEKELFLHYLKHYRHDWLNHVQVLKGYLALGKIEDVQRYMDKIILKAQDESKLNQLGDPELAFHLLTFNWRCEHVRLEVEIDHQDEETDLQSITEKCPSLATWIYHITQMVESRCDRDQENRLFLTFEVQKNIVILFIEFMGHWKEQSDKKGLYDLVDSFQQTDRHETRFHVHHASEWDLQVAFRV